MLVGSMNIHRIVSITTRTKSFSNFIAQEFIFTDDSGNTIALDAFSAVPLGIVHLASHDAQPAVTVEAA